MSSQRLLRVKRSDVADDLFVLLHVASNGDSPLDLNLSASEGENPYVTTSTSNPALPSHSAHELYLSIASFRPSMVLTWQSYHSKANSSGKVQGAEL
jgi:hypothetical protein